MRKGKLRKIGLTPRGGLCKTRNIKTDCRRCRRRNGEKKNAVGRTQKGGTNPENTREHLLQQGTPPGWGTTEQQKRRPQEGKKKSRPSAVDCRTKAALIQAERETGERGGYARGQEKLRSLESTTPKYQGKNKRVTERNENKPDRETGKHVH